VGGYICCIQPSDFFNRAKNYPTSPQALLEKSKIIKGSINDTDPSFEGGIDYIAAAEAEMMQHSFLNACGAVSQSL